MVHCRAGNAGFELTSSRTFILLDGFACFIDEIPEKSGRKKVELDYHPMVSILIATFNERFVIEKSLDAVKRLDYPRHKIQVVVADDSNDLTAEIIENKVRELNRSGIKAVVSRRPTRENFKCGALNKAMDYVVGEYVLLLDADSIIPSDILSKGIDTLETHDRASFVSYRYGHYNRSYNKVTKLFALSQDIGDTLSKMGSYRIDAPFSFQGGFTMVRTKDLRDVGQWSNERIADDTDVSIKLLPRRKARHLPQQCNHNERRSFNTGSLEKAGRENFSRMVAVHCQVLEDYFHCERCLITKEVRSHPHAYEPVFIFELDHRDLSFLSRGFVEYCHAG